MPGGGFVAVSRNQTEEEALHWIFEYRPLSTPQLSSTLSLTQQFRSFRLIKGKKKQIAFFLHQHCCLFFLFCNTHTHTHIYIYIFYGYWAFFIYKYIRLYLYWFVYIDRQTDRQTEKVRVAHIHIYERIRMIKKRHICGEIKKNFGIVTVEKDILAQAP